MKSGYNLIIMGPPGAGKGTQADLLAKRYKIPHISTGDMFREILKDNQSQLSQEIKVYVQKGELVPDNLVLEMVRTRLQENDVKNGFILDGFPRTKIQAEGLDEILKVLNKQLDLAIYLKTSYETILDRLTGRRVCLHCGANYHIKYSPPKEEGICDRCGGELYQREDDKEETIRKRLEIYETQTREIIDYYRNKNILFTISGDLSAKDIFKKVEEKLTELEQVN
ncbi:MAG TPA: adenylate kinase [Candidatus Omnitrophica bacterium]|nr:adenylate kinase [Candidatus Omnitrophota bacterium]